MAIAHDNRPTTSPSNEPTSDLSALSGPSSDRFQVAGLFGRRRKEEAAPEAAPPAPAAEPVAAAPTITVPARPAEGASTADKQNWQTQLKDIATTSEAARKLLGEVVYQSPEVRGYFKLGDADITSCLGANGQLNFAALGDKALANFLPDGKLGKQTDTVEAVLQGVAGTTAPAQAPAQPAPQTTDGASGVTVVSTESRQVSTTPPAEAPPAQNENRGNAIRRGAEIVRDAENVVNTVRRIGRIFGN